MILNNGCLKSEQKKWNCLHYTSPTLQNNDLFIHFLTFLPGSGSANLCGSGSGQAKNMRIRADPDPKPCWRQNPYSASFYGVYPADIPVASRVLPAVVCLPATLLGYDGVLFSGSLISAERRLCIWATHTNPGKTSSHRSCSQGNILLCKCLFHLSNRKKNHFYNNDLSLHDLQSWDMTFGSPSILALVSFLTLFVWAGQRGFIPKSF